MNDDGKEWKVQTLMDVEAWWQQKWWQDILAFGNINELKMHLPIPGVLAIVQQYLEERELLLHAPQKSIYPLRPEFKGLRKLYADAKETFWVEEEIDLTQDALDYQELTQDEKDTMKFFLSFFVFADTLVSENLAKFSQHFQVPEIRKFYAQQSAIEEIHDTTYALMNNVIIPEKEQEAIRTAWLSHEIVKVKSAWIQKGFDDNINLAIRIILWCIVEGVFFCSSFAFFFYLRQCHHTKFPGLIHANEFIMRDETLHMNFGCEMFWLWKHKPPQSMVHNLFRSAIAVEDLFVEAAIPAHAKLTMLTSQQMKNYVRFMADRLLGQLGFDKLFHVANPFVWMEQTALETRNHFFERRTGGYQSASFKKKTIKQKTVDSTTTTAAAISPSEESFSTLVELE
jgi:ribonucleotide reductase beta subunit family protein with ferritin-like domain